METSDVSSLRLCDIIARVNYTEGKKDLEEKKKAILDGPKSVDTAAEVPRLRDVAPQQEVIAPQVTVGIMFRNRKLPTLDLRWIPAQIGNCSISMLSKILPFMDKFSQDI